MRRIVLASVPALTALFLGLACAESTSDGFGGGDEGGGSGEGGATTTTSSTTTTSASSTSASTTAATTTTSVTSVTSVTSSSTTGGGTCDDFLCAFECLASNGTAGACVNGVCDCNAQPLGSAGSLIGSAGSFFISESGGGGAGGVSNPAFEYDGFESAE